MTKICVVGLGYIGLPISALLANRGFQVHGVDVSQKVVDIVNSGGVHIVEPGLEEAVNAAVAVGDFVADTKLKAADIFIIAVPTPFKADHVPDLSHVEAAANSISDYIQPGNLVIIESTVPVGTTDETVGGILRSKGHKLGTDVFLAHCPERVLPGNIMEELLANDRVVGGIDELSSRKAEEFYSSFVEGEVIVTNSKTAELVKLTENSFRDVNIAFANEISMIADSEDIDPWEVIELANRHPRVQILQPGPGVGGHCIAVDPWFIVSRSPDIAKLIRTSREVNNSKPKWIVEKVKFLARKYDWPTIGCLGLAFKANIDDLRQSPAMGIARQLVMEKIGDVLVCEPNISTVADFELVDLDEVILKSDIILILVDHKEFLDLNSEKLKGKELIDTRGIIR